MIPPHDDRYGRQIQFHELGRQGQDRIRCGRVVVIGVGALGCQEAALLVRAGVGSLRLVDRDFVETSNLHRQILFTEDDAARGLPKAEAARIHLSASNRDVEIQSVVADVDASTIESLVTDVDVIVDGSDNFEVRYLMNDVAVRDRRPWVYAASVGASGFLMPVLPGITPCLRCLVPEPPPTGTAETCETAGVVGPAPAVVGSLAAMEALKILSGRADAVLRGAYTIDLWTNRMRRVDVERPTPDCPCCGKRQFSFLEDRRGTRSAQLCGRNAVQVRPAAAAPFPYDEVVARLRGSTELTENPYLARFCHGEIEVHLFRDGRAIVTGTDDPARARAIYARFVG